MKAGEIRLGPEVPNLAALGPRTFEDFFSGCGAPGFERATVMASSPGFELVRCPLPGTPVDGKRFQGGPPRGAGTGWIWISRWTEASRRERWFTRFTHPRSTSFAEREWNVICHLRGHGVATPELLAVGRGSGALFARRSFLVVRELDGMRPLSEVARKIDDPRAVRAVARALGLALGHLFQAGVAHYALHANTIWVGSPRLGPAEGHCVARLVAPRPTTEGGADRAKELRWSALPEIAFTGLDRARIRRRVTWTDRGIALMVLAEDLRDVPKRAGLRVACAAAAGLGPVDAKRAKLLFTNAHPHAARRPRSRRVQRGSSAGGASSPT